MCMHVVCVRACRACGACVLRVCDVCVHVCVHMWCVHVHACVRMCVHMCVCVVCVCVLFNIKCVLVFTKTLKLLSGTFFIFKKK